MLLPQWQMVKPRWAGGLRLVGLIFSAGAMGQESGHAYGRARTGSSPARWRGAGLWPGAEPAPLGLRRAPAWSARRTGSAPKRTAGAFWRNVAAFGLSAPEVGPARSGSATWSEHGGMPSAHPARAHPPCRFWAWLPTRAATAVGVPIGCSVRSPASDGAPLKGTRLPDSQVPAARPGRDGVSAAPVGQERERCGCQAR